MDTHKNEMVRPGLFILTLTKNLLYSLIGGKMLYGRKLTNDDLDPREPTTTPRLKNKKEVTWLPKLRTDGGVSTWFFDLFIVPPWKRDGFKRALGFVGSSAGFVLQFIPKYQTIGNVLLGVFGSLGIGGMFHGKAKNKKTTDKTQIIKTIVLFFWNWIVEMFGKKKT